MSDMKTVETDADPHAFLAAVAHPGRRADAQAVAAMMQRVTGWPPRMWGESIVGFGAYDYRRRDGSAHRFFRVGLAPRKAALTIYLMPGVARHAALLAKLGPHRHSVSCLYLGRLRGIDMEVLETLVRRSVADMAALYPQPEGDA
ncbi:DUF1801 domain-containing protein [Rhodobacteraceae bacterium 2CG4]|uniref:DUF1801 domain-containing protein n=1 Tax=Halovulum marinum TaxID=2662447 RepID=A0A6L5Z0L5_9RHOB|nr:DUF1801 domain-containing protein [Halovulum marinum]MSU89622.1 DUF1801 domain-containing protein [Halovulum marinum]